MFLPVRLKSFFLARILAIALRRLLSFALALVFGLTSVVSWPRPAQAQTGAFQPITALNAVRVATPPSPTVTVEFADPCDSSAANFPGCAGVDVDLTYGQGGNLVLESFGAGGLTLTRENIASERVVFERNNDPTFNRDVLFYEHQPIPAGTLPAAIDLFPELAAQIPDALLSPIINRGVDNIFNNVGITVQDSRNNLERIDYIIDGGLEIPANELDTSGYLILERGVGDAVGIAAITAVDGLGNPTAYGPLIQVPVGADWGTSAVNLETIVFRRDLTLGELDLRPSHRVVSQQVRGLFFPISALIDTTAGTPQTIFGYSLVAGDVAPGTDLTQPQNFPTNTGGDSATGGLDLVAGGFGLFRVPQPPPGNLFINKRITELTVSGTAVPRTEVQNGTDNGMPEIVAAGLGQGALNVTDAQLRPGDEIEYTLYFNNTLTGTVTDVVVCDAIPGGTTFIPDTYGAGSGLQLAAPTAPQAPPYPTTTLTNAAGDDAGTFLPPGTVLPEFCRTLDQGNGAFLVEVPQVAGGQVGFVRFKARVNDPPPPTP